MEISESNKTLMKENEELESLSKKLQAKIDELHSLNNSSSENTF